MIGNDSIIQMNFESSSHYNTNFLIGELCQCFECSNWNQGDKLSSVCFYLLSPFVDSQELCLSFDNVIRNHLKEQNLCKIKFKGLMLHSGNSCLQLPFVICEKKVMLT